MTNYQLTLLTQAIEGTLDPALVPPHRVEALSGLLEYGYLDQDFRPTPVGHMTYRTHMDGE